MTTSEKRKATLKKSQQESRRQKKINGLKQVSFYLDQEILDKLKKECKSKGLSYAEFVSKSLEQPANNNDKNPQDILILKNNSKELAEEIEISLLNVEEKINYGLKQEDRMEKLKIEKVLLPTLEKCKTIYQYLYADIIKHASINEIKCSFSFDEWIKDMLMDLCSDISLSNELEQLINTSKIKLYKYYYEDKMQDYFNFELDL